MRQHTSAYVSVSQHMSAYVSVCPSHLLTHLLEHKAVEILDEGGKKKELLHEKN